MTYIFYAILDGSSTLQVDTSQSGVLSDTPMINADYLANEYARSIGDPFRYNRSSSNAPYDDYVGVLLNDIKDADEIVESELTVYGYTQIPSDDIDSDDEWWFVNGTEIAEYCICEINSKEH